MSCAPNPRTPIEVVVRNCATHLAPFAYARRNARFPRYLAHVNLPGARQGAQVRGVKDDEVEKFCKTGQKQLK